MIEVIDFPKVKSPFVRETIGGHYVVTPNIEPGYQWVFEDDGVMAMDKLHGTNVCVVGRQIMSIFVGRAEVGHLGVGVALKACSFNHFCFPFRVLLLGIQAP